MEQSNSMDASLKQAIEEMGFAAVSKEAGIPLTTIWRWTSKGSIPGTGATKAWRADQLEQAIERLRAAHEAA